MSVTCSSCGTERPSGTKCRTCHAERERKRRAAIKAEFESGDRKRASRGTCVQCGETKPASSFHLSWTHPSGLQRRCKSCAEVPRKKRRKLPKKSKPSQVVVTKKRCPRCEEVKPADAFAKSRATPDGLNNYCRECRSLYHRGRKYGISAEEIIALYDRWGAKCACCGVPEKDASGSSLVIDHCHNSGKVRMLLCQKCNVGIGLFKDSPDLLRRAAVLLESHG